MLYFATKLEERRLHVRTGSFTLPAPSSYGTDCTRVDYYFPHVEGEYTVTMRNLDKPTHLVR